MTDQKFHLLIYQQLRDGQLPPEQANQLQEWLNENPVHRKEAADIEAIWNASDPAADQRIELDVEDELKALQTRLKTLKKPEPVMSVRSSRRIWMATAAALSLLLTAVWFWANNRTASWQTLMADNHQVLEITLSDGSKVRLNRNSTLEYPQTFTDNKRLVRLKGEALFEVTANPNQPFIVESGQCQTTVLGTVFNVRALPEEQAVEVALFSGRVQLKSPVGLVEISPGTTAVFNQMDNTLKTEKNIAVSSAAWYTGSLKFEHIALSEALLQLQRLFGQSIKLENPALARCSYSAYFPKNDLEIVLTNLRTVFDLIAEKTPDGYLLKGGHCPD